MAAVLGAFEHKSVPYTCVVFERTPALGWYKGKSVATSYLGIPFACANMHAYGAHPLPDCHVAPKAPMTSRKGLISPGAISPQPDLPYIQSTLLKLENIIRHFGALSGW